MQFICTKHVKVPVWFIMIGAVMVCNFVALHLLDLKVDLARDNENLVAVQGKESTLHDETNVKIPSSVDGTQISLEERVRYLELKVNAFMNFGSDPYFGLSERPHHCRTTSSLQEFGCKAGLEGVPSAHNVKQNCPGLFDHVVCLDQLPPPGTTHKVKEVDDEDKQPPCLVYDFGIRAQPQFGASMARDFGCEVHAFDPSPVSTEWWSSKDAEPLRNLPNYHFHPYGSGGKDGDITLKEYNWGQVSILRYPTYTLNCTGKSANCEMKNHQSKSFTLPVKTLPTIRKELGHEDRTIDLLKIDVEGSEYAFMENMLDSSGGCPDFINQISLEWHHFPWDVRYGEGSSPFINTIATLLHTCGLKMIWRQ